MPSLYQISVPLFIKNLGILSKLLAKGSAHAAVSDEQLVNSRLIADMQNLIYQVQRASDTSKFLAVRAGKVEPVVMEDNEKTMEELQERITKTIKVLESVKESDFVGEDEEIAFTVSGHEMKFTGKSYALDFAIPNFFFHLVTTYALLRKEGVDVGKKDYLGM